jgi:serine/threonine protein kinase
VKNFVEMEEVQLYTKKTNNKNEIILLIALIYHYYGRKSFLWIITELMDCSLDKFFKKSTEIGLRIPEYFMAFIAHSIVNGLIYLKNLQIIHRDVKPSNMLTSAKSGFIKLCDFGISGFAKNSMCESFAGFQMYMAVYIYLFI